MASKAKKAVKSKAKPKGKAAGKAASSSKKKTTAKVLPFVKPAPKPAAKAPVPRPKQVDRKSTFAELGTSLFPKMSVLNNNNNTPGAAFTSRFTRSLITWPRFADNSQAFVPEIMLHVRTPDGKSETMQMPPTVAAQICAALLVSMAELEIQCPKNVGLSGKHWTLLVQRMRELKMIDVDMPEDYIAEPEYDTDD